MRGKSTMRHHNNFLRGAVLLLIASIFILSTCGCSVAEYVFKAGRYKAIGENPPNPFPDIKKVAVTPFATDEALQNVPLNTSLKYAQITATELAQFKGFEVVRAYKEAVAPEQQSYAPGAPPAPKVSGDESQSFAKDIDADAILIGSITDYDPYIPRMGITLHAAAHALWRRRTVVRRPRTTRADRQANHRDARGKDRQNHGHQD